jgi:SAM-dependent methyltransferase
VLRILRALPLRRCPVCEAAFARFAVSGPDGGERRACPRCGSRQRHRLLAIYFRDRTDLFRRAQDVLHFAPEQGMGARLRAVHGAGYVSVDVDQARADVAADITDLPFADASFDVVLCVHVLEHVTDDRAAMRQLRRVLRPTGWAVIQVPIQRDVTIEDPEERDPAQRLRRFGQDDHVRMYGNDFFDRLREAGFAPAVVDMRADLGRFSRWRCGLGYARPEIDALPAAWQVYRAEVP